MGTIFSKIIAGEIPAYKVAEDAQHLAILDVNPLVEGHILVLPKTEVNYIFDMEHAAYASLWAFAHQVALAQKQVIPCLRIGVAVIGLEVPHVHIHLVPLFTAQDINFTKERAVVAPERMAELAREISLAR